MLKTLTPAQIRKLALQNKFEVNAQEIKIIQREFHLNTSVNLQNFHRVCDKFLVNNEKVVVPFVISTFFRQDEIIDDKRREDFLANLKNKTVDGYVYVLKQKSRIKTGI